MQHFTGHEWPSLGVELEFQLVDKKTIALRNVVNELLADLSPELKPFVKPEFLQCYVEVTSSPCLRVDELHTDLTQTVQAVEMLARRHHARLFWAATHPFSYWQDQEITPNERYYRLAELMQEAIVRRVTFGMHVQVGVPSGDAAVRRLSRLKPYIPMLLALSANSPFWHGRPTGYHSHRVELTDGLPTGGLPPSMTGWNEYCDLVEQMQTAGCIETGHELWWDVRPNERLGTIELRICDMPPNMTHVLGLAALAQCLVCELLQQGEPAQPETALDAAIIRQNRWRASRFGLEAELVDPVSLEKVPVRGAVQELINRLRPVSQTLGCQPHLNAILGIATGRNGAQWQLETYEQLGDYRLMIEESLNESTLEPATVRV